MNKYNLPWRSELTGTGGSYIYDCKNDEVVISSEDWFAGDPYFDDDIAKRIVACVNACGGLPTEALERVEAGKSSVIIADEVINGQRTHFVMPDSVKE